MILSIESSCDDSSIAITKIKSKELVFHKKISQELSHSKYGGVVPELAARLHAKALPRILLECKAYFHELKAIAVTNEPGLSVSLVEGVSMAKTLSLSLNLPLIAINHLIGHMYSVFIQKEAIFPLGVMLVTGGHTQVFKINEDENIKILANTLDDSFGESFDKVAKMLNLSYPGGPIIENLAKEGSVIYNFSVPLSNSPKLSFSYSGLKNQVRICIENEKNLDENKANIAKSFQEVAIKHLMQKLNKIFKFNSFSHFALVGGASANISLRNSFEKLCQKYNILPLYAPMQFCSDNAAMIGRAAISKYEKQNFSLIHEISINPKIKNI